MRRCLLDLCLLAYPRAVRERDREYLRDLALDLAETQGLQRQALSLLGGGLRERIEDRRRRSGGRRGTWVQRTVVASCVLAALVFAATSLIGPPEGDGERVRDVEQLTCQYMDHPPSKRHREPVSGTGACAKARRLVAARARAGWDCTTRRRTSPDRREIAWRCARGTELVASLAP